MLLVAVWVGGHLQAEHTQQEARLHVEAGKVLQDVQVEGRTIGTHLQITPGSSLRSEDQHCRGEAGLGLT